MADSVTVPEAKKDLLERAIVVVLGSILPSGAPHLAPVWRRWDGTHILITSDSFAQKVKNVRANSHVSVMTIDPENTGRYLEIRGVVEAIETDHDLCLAELDRHTKMYTGKDTYFGAIEPAESAASFDGALLRIKPTKIVC